MSKLVLTSGSLHDIAHGVSIQVPELLASNGLVWGPGDAGNIVTQPGQLDYYEWYYAYGRLLAPKRIVEIGVYGGGSVALVCLGAVNPPALIELIDNESYGSSLAEVSERLRKIAPECLIVAIPEDSQRLAELPVPAEGRFDLVSIDGDHRVGPCYHDLRITLPHLTQDGHILVDDARYPWVRDAVTAFVADHPELHEIYVETFTGTSILHRENHIDRCPLLSAAS